MIAKKGFYAYGFSRVFWSFVIGFLVGAILMYLALKSIINVPFLK